MDLGLTCHSEPGDTLHERGLLRLKTSRVLRFGGELLDPIGVPGIWFPFNIGVSRTQYVYAIAVPLLAFLIVRTFRTLDPGILRAVD